MRKFTGWAKRGLMVFSPVTLLVAMTATAAPNQEMSPAIRAALQRDLGLTAAQLAQYQRIERLAAAAGASTCAPTA